MLESDVTLEMLGYCDIVFEKLTETGMAADDEDCEEETDAAFEFESEFTAMLSEELGDTVRDWLCDAMTRLVVDAAETVRLGDVDGEVVMLGLPVKEGVQVPVDEPVAAWLPVPEDDHEDDALGVPLGVKDCVWVTLGAASAGVITCANIE
jgi:hypothetical protein